MKLIKADPTLVSKPKFVVSCSSKQTIDVLVKKFTKSKNIGENFVSIVTSDGNFVAVDNIDILDAAIAAKLKKINLIHMGAADPLLAHLKIQSSKTMTNPARVMMAMNELNRADVKTESLDLNGYLEKITFIKFDEDTLKKLADLIDSVFSAGIKLSPPLPFFHALSKLELPQQKIIIQRTMYNAEELKMKYFKWPDTHIITHMLDEKYDSPAKPKEMIAKGIPAFDCKGCGQKYGIINNEICTLEDKHGCLVVQDRLGTVIHQLPANIIQFLGLKDTDAPPRFSKCNGVEDLKKLGISGPFVIAHPKIK